MTAGGGDALLQLAHLVGQRRLVAHRRRHPAEQRGDLGAGLGEAEDVVDEQQHVLVLHVAEVLGHGQRGQADPHPDAGRLVHLAEHQGRVVDDAGLGHLQEQVVALAGPLAHPGEHRDAAEFLATRRIISWMSTVLPTPAPPNRPIFPPCTYGVEQVDDLDAGRRTSAVSGSSWSNRRRVAVDRPALGDVQRRVGTSSGSPRTLNTWPLVTSPTGTVMRRTGVDHLAPRTRPSVGCMAMAAHDVVADVLLDLQGQRPRLAVVGRRPP